MPSHHRVSFLVLLTACLSSSVAQAVKIEWVPVRASGTYEIHDHEIVLEKGGQRVWFEAKISGWAPDQLRFYDLHMSRLLFGTGRPGLPLPALPPCQSFEDCMTALGSFGGCGEFCMAGEFDLSACYRTPNCGTGFCEARCVPGFVDTTREDFVFNRGYTSAGFADTGALEYRVLSSAGDAYQYGADDDGTAKYIGTFVLDVPEGWAGTFTLEFDTSTSNTVVGGPYGRPIVSVAAHLTGRCSRDEECDDQDVCTAGRCDVETSRCRFDPVYDTARFCCNSYTGALQMRVEDDLECTSVGCEPLAGKVIQLPIPYRTPCGDPTSSPCDDPDTCDGSGNCLRNRHLDGARCEDALFCNGAEICSRGACVSLGYPRCGDEEACDEERETCRFEPSPFMSIPPHNGSLSRRDVTIVLYRTEGELPTVLSALPDFELRQLLPNGRVGPDLFFNFYFRELTTVGGGVGTALVIGVGGTTAPGNWYSLRHVGRWGGLRSFEIHVLAQPGDANGDGNVNAADLTAINNMIGHWNRSDPFQHRLDVFEDGQLNFRDVTEASRHIPSRRVPKPSGH